MRSWLPFDEELISQVKLAYGDAWQAQRSLGVGCKVRVASRVVINVVALVKILAKQKGNELQLGKGSGRRGREINFERKHEGRRWERKWGSALTLRFCEKFFDDESPGTQNQQWASVV
jgi:hypothetical protein